MKRLASLFIVFLMLSACSSSKKIQEEAKAYVPVTDTAAQVQRAISMIKADKELSEEQKKELEKLVFVHTDKAEEIRKKQSQIRAMLIEELLKSSHGKKSLSITSAKALDKLNKEHINNLDDFIRKFRVISGEADRNQDIYMRQIAGHAFM
jgi:hypothetical protein